MKVYNTTFKQEEDYCKVILTKTTDTEFYKEISTSKQLKTIQSLVGTLGFQGTDFSKYVFSFIGLSSFIPGNSCVQKFN